jgi:SAM-dependent methyltransferase
MRDDFNSDAYLSYLLTHCNETQGEGVDRVGGADQIARHLAALELDADSRALEIGCGTGRVLEIARREFGVRMYGCDVSRPAIDYIRVHRPAFADRVFVLDDQGLRVAPSGWADAVVFWGCFELVPQRASLLEAARILRVGGRALLSSVKHEAPFEDDEDAQAALRAYREKRVPIAVSDPVRFERFARSLGFEIERRIVFERKRDLVPDRFVVDAGGARTFSEAFYLLRKTAEFDVAADFSRYFGADEAPAFV